MEKYITFDHIRKKDISNFSGLENEVLTYIYHSPNKVPVSIECFGITYPNPNFHIKRINATYFILEYIMSGKGYLVVCDSNGYMFLIDGETGSQLYLLSLGKMVEASPAIYENRIVVGLKKGPIHCIEIQ